MTPKPEFEELDYRETPLGELILRRRTILSLDNREVHEIILGDAFLMSSLFTEVEEALARLGLAAAGESIEKGAKLDVVIGGLGLGYTGRAALEHPALGSLLIVDYLKPVIEWHETGLAPLGAELTADPRCRFVHGDFFQLALGEKETRGFDPDSPDRKFHAILLDIDHSPDNLLHERHHTFYEAEGLRIMADRLLPGGVFGLWSDAPPEENFMSALNEVFDSCESNIVTFFNPLQDKESSSTVYLARKS